jgi:hypothetical protein
MSAQAKARDAKIRNAESDLGNLNSELQLDLLQMGVDAAGVIDPSPASDLLGAGLSIYRGDFIGAGLSLISVIPYAGDALAKTTKGARILKNANNLRKRIAVVTDQINALRKQGREAASAAARAKKQAKKAGEAVDEAYCQKCAEKLDLGENPFGTRTPRNGWPQGVTRGDGPWIPDNSTEYGKALLKWQEKNGIPPGTPIQYRQGFPDFTPYAKHQVKINMTGVDSMDFAAADAAMKKLDPKWSRGDWTWHHSEDGVTMQLVPRELNGIPHTGGAALSEIPGF